MKTRLIGLSVSTLFVAALVCAPFAPGLTPAANAQQTDAKPAPKGKTARMDKTWEERTEQRIADLQAQLLITAEQQKAFDDLANVMRDNAKIARDNWEKWYKDSGALNAVDSLKAHASMSQLRAKSMERLVAVFETLYKQLSDEQKKIADEVFSRHGRRGPAKNKARGPRQ
ncbi:hypothetical protein JCM15519_02090 [Fundidesulfovibrio butyratiphilus]